MIGSQILNKVAKNLGLIIKRDTDYKGRFMITEDLPVNGYFRFENDGLYVSTMIGASGGDFNKNLFPKLRGNANFRNAIKRVHGENVVFQRLIRRFANPYRPRAYYLISKFNTLEEYLRDLSINGYVPNYFAVTHSKVSADNFKRRIDELGTLWKSDNADNYSFADTYNWLEYLEIADYRPIKIDPEGRCISEVEAKIQRHARGMEFLVDIKEGRPLSPIFDDAFDHSTARIATLDDDDIIEDDGNFGFGTDEEWEKFVGKKNFSYREIDDIVKGKTALPPCNTFPFGTPSKLYPELFVVCEFYNSLENIFSYIFKDWCEKTKDKFPSRKVIIATEIWNTMLFERFKTRFADSCKGVEFEIKFIL